ncbi:MAG: hypothetical protein NZ455_03745 [Bacteroidia bacterium]|nr:hypothetical protein [Bacteroidia bacterium]
MGVTLRVCPQGRRATGCASLRCCATLRTGLTPTLRMPHAGIKYANSIYSKFNLVST